jgi:hypothetical protein
MLEQREEKAVPKAKEVCTPARCSDLETPDACPPKSAKRAENAAPRP